MLASNVPAFLKMLLIAAVIEKRFVPASVTLPMVGGGGLVYACVLPRNFLPQNPIPPKDAPRAVWRAYAYAMADQVEFQLEDVKAKGLQS